MKSSKTNQDGVFKTLHQDLGHGGHYRTIRRDYRDLKDFYIDEERRQKLAGKNIVSRSMLETWWLLKGLFYNLSPTRRLLLVLGFVLSMNHMTLQAGGAIISDNGFLGFALLLFVLILELKDKLLAHDELESGRSIQRALMPNSCPELKDWSVWFDSRPAREVGGDLVDCLDVGNGSMTITLADVAGKGLRAALLSSKLQATVRALASEVTSLPDLCAKVNSIFHRDSLKSIFASLLVLELRPDSGTIRYVNAGHLPPILVTKNDVHEMKKGHLALGLAPSSTYEDHVVDLQPGDVFFAFTDGLTEAQNEQGVQYGIERLSERLRQLRHLSAREIGETLFRNIDSFVGEASVRDDLSMMVIKRTSEV